MSGKIALDTNIVIGLRYLPRMPPFKRNLRKRARSFCQALLLASYISGHISRSALTRICGELQNLRGEISC